MKFLRYGRWQAALLRFTLLALPIFLLVSGIRNLLIIPAFCFICQEYHCKDVQRILGLFHDLYTIRLTL